ncbi:MAG: glycosyl hydrolase 53 family protein [Bacteroidota bacterium]
MKQSKMLFFIKHLPVSILFLLFLFQPQEVHSQFANGADIGWLSQMEAQGYVFNNDSGVQENCLVILKEHGINALRFRVWVNPTGKYCSKKDVAYMSHRADSMGFRVMIDFHLSDWWADPKTQTKPAAWASHTVAQLDSDVYHHVYEILDTLKTIGVTPAWVQIGNETNDGMLWEDGRASTHMNNFAAMVLSGYNAVKAVDTTIQVIVHLSNGHDNAMFRWMFDGLISNGAKWDIIGMSVYPYWANWPNSLPWATDDSLALITMKDMIARYQTKVMVTETGYLYNQAVDANKFLIDLIRKTKSVGGLGVFYWEPECYNWQSYNLGAWDPSTKKPTVAMDAFLDTVITSVNREEIISHYALNVYPNPFNPTTTIEFTLAEDSHVLVKVYDVLGREVAILINQDLKAGEPHSSVFNASRLTSGIYFCCLETEKSFLVKKLMLLK